MSFLIVQAPFYPREMPSLGIACLKAALELKQINVEIVDLHSFSLAQQQVLKEFSYQFYELEGVHARINLEKIANFSFKKSNAHIKRIIQVWVHTISASSPEMIGISVYDISILYSLLLAQQIKQKSSPLFDRRVILGGPSMSNRKLVDGIKQLTYIDAIVCGEAEKALPAVISLIKENRFTKKVYVQRDVVDINHLPYPNFDKEDIALKEHSHIVPIEMSRGCFHRCTFCAGRLTYGRYRRKNNDRIVKEILHQTKNLGTDTFWFSDALINADCRILEQLCDEIIERRLKVFWGGYATLHSGFSDSFCKKLYTAGCRFLRFGAESGSQAVLNHMCKKTTIRHVERILKNVHSANISTRLSFIVGYPTETNTDFQQTFEFIIRNSNYINLITVHEYIQEENLESENPLKQLNMVDSNKILLRSAILELFVKTQPMFELFLKTSDYRNFKNKGRPREKIFHRRILWDSIYYHDDYSDVLKDENFLRKGNNIDVLLIEDKGEKIFLSFDCNNIGDKTTIERLNTVIEQIDSDRLVFLRPIPECIMKSDLWKDVDAPKSCRECAECIIKKDGTMKACITLLEEATFSRATPKRICSNCEYFMNNNCYPCYYLNGENYCEV